jgi:hypothetical protein
VSREKGRWGEWEKGEGEIENQQQMVIYNIMKLMTNYIL